MPLFSAFTVFGHLAFSSTPSHGESLYEDLTQRLGGDGKNYDLTPGTYEEAKVYARAMHYARVRSTLERAQNQKHPGLAIEMLPVLERDWGVQVGPKDTVLDRQRALATAMLAPLGASVPALVTQLQALLGPDFLAIRVRGAGEANAWPATMGSVGSFPADAGMPSKTFFLVDPIAVTGTPFVFRYRRPGLFDDGVRLRVGDRVTIDVENFILAETVTITAVHEVLHYPPTLTATAVFTKAHSAPDDAIDYPGASLVVGPSPMLASTQRTITVVVTSAAARSAETRRRIHETCRRACREVDQWAIVEPSRSNQLGPFTVGQSLIGDTTMGLATY